MKKKKKKKSSTSFEDHRRGAGKTTGERGGHGKPKRFSVRPTGGGPVIKEAGRGPNESSAGRLPCVVTKRLRRPRREKIDCRAWERRS